MSLYQKYRSQTFADIITQEHVTSTLQAAIKNGNFGHAYLFVGTRGTGKTSIARIFARTINCHNIEFVREHGEPCNVCQSCLEALKGSNIDIIEMDAASNRGIEEVRNLKEAVDFLPSIGNYKVYIIDEAHMMTKEAFNALLKTIEEPPKHIVFIMCTTELFKVPATIVSRSQVFELKHASIKEIVQKIDKILEAESVSFQIEAKEFIAKLGKGSFRDTESILEKVLASVRKKTEVSLDEVISSLGLSSIYLIQKAKELFYRKDILQLKEFLDNEIEEGSIISFLHQVGEEVYSDLTEELKKDSWDSYKIELFDFLSALEKEVRNSVSPKMLLIAKTLNWIKNYSPRFSQSYLSEEQALNQNTGERAINTENSLTKNTELPSSMNVNPLNPSAFLRQKKSQQKVVSDSSNHINQEKTKPAFLSKIDFLDFMKKKNAFLFRFFSHHEFTFQENVLLIDAERQMERDLVMKHQTIQLIQAFAAEHNIVLKVEFSDVKVDKRKKEEKEVEEVKRTVADLSDKEIKEIFS